MASLAPAERNAYFRLPSGFHYSWQRFVRMEYGRGLATGKLRGAGGCSSPRRGIGADGVGAG